MVQGKADAHLHGGVVGFLLVGLGQHLYGGAGPGQALLYLRLGLDGQHEGRQGRRLGVVAQLRVVISFDALLAVVGRGLGLQQGERRHVFLLVQVNHTLQRGGLQRAAAVEQHHEPGLVVDLGGLHVQLRRVQAGFEHRAGLGAGLQRYRRVIQRQADVKAGLGLRFGGGLNAGRIQAAGGVGLHVGDDLLGGPALGRFGVVLKL